MNREKIADILVKRMSSWSYTTCLVIADDIIKACEEPSPTKKIEPIRFKIIGSFGDREPPTNLEIAYKINEIIERMGGC